jgi:hypothetical protein
MKPNETPEARLERIEREYRTACADARDAIAARDALLAERRAAPDPVARDAARAIRDAAPPERPARVLLHPSTPEMIAIFDADDAYRAAIRAIDGVVPAFREREGALGILQLARAEDRRPFFRDQPPSVIADRLADASAAASQAEGNLAEALELLVATWSTS